MESAPAPAVQSPAISTSSFPAPRSRIILFSLLALAAGIGTAVWLGKMRFERFPGFLQARLQTLTAGREARIAQILVTPGTVVTPGQPIVVLDDQDLAQRVQISRQEIQSLEIELSRTQAALEVELDIQRRDILDRVFATKCRSAQLMRQQFLGSPEGTLSSRMANRWKSDSPPPVNFISRSSQMFEDVSRNEQAAGGRATAVNRGMPARALTAEMELCIDHIAQLEKMSQELPQKIARSMGADLAQARLEHARESLASLEKQQKELTLVADTAGMIGVFHKQVGDRVSAHEPIVQLLDEEQPYLMLQVPSPRISDFAPGTVVELRFPGGEKGKGRVETIPPQTSDVPDEQGARPETMITAHIDPVGKLWPNLPFGSVVEVRRKR
jgi:multidrug resistance efflux pump